MPYQKQIIATEKAPQAVGTYSQGVVHENVYYFSGQIGLDPQTMNLRSGVEAQLQQILKNIDGLLEHCKIDRSHILKTSIFMTDLKDFDIVNQAYTQYFKDPFPARSCVQVSALPKNALIEIEVIAAK